jgi:lysophospholipase L1-like esterase
MPSFSSFTRRAARFTSIAALAAAIVVPVASSTSSASPRSGNDRNGTYLALGDSVAFGYVPPNATPAPNYANQWSFISYANYVARDYGVRVVNASCPGETTASMLNVTAQSNGCENSYVSGESVPEGYRTLYPLHVQYQGTQTAFAVQYLTRHKHTRFVTIDIGANDAFLCQDTTADGCTSPSELANVGNVIATNLASIYAQIRKVYAGPIIALDYYSLDYNSLADNETSAFLNSVINQVTTAYGGTVADGFGAFETASGAGLNPCTAGLLIPVPGGCNIHPTHLGHQVLAQAIEKALASTGVQPIRWHHFESRHH